MNCKIMISKTNKSKTMDNNLANIHPLICNNILETEIIFLHSLQMHLTMMTNKTKINKRSNNKRRINQNNKKSQLQAKSKSYHKKRNLNNLKTTKTNKLSNRMTNDTFLHFYIIILLIFYSSCFPLIISKIFIWFKSTLNFYFKIYLIFIFKSFRFLPLFQFNLQHSNYLSIVKILQTFQNLTNLMSDQQQILPCVQCNKHHEQMLMLSCLHDPCINCAAIHYVQNCPKNSLFYSCAKCKDQTQLDSSSVVQLQRVYRTLKPVQQTRDSRKQEKKFQYNRSIPKVSRQINNPPYYPQVPSYKNQKTTYTQPLSYQPISPISPINTPQYQAPRRATITQTMCSQHPQDQLSYFCFSCNKPICPQCAIHGSHRQHEVQTCRRAIPAIKQRLNQANQSLTVEIGNLNHRKNQTRQYISGLTQTNKRDHQMIKRQFTRLKTLLSQKQDQFIRAMNENYQRNCQQAKYYTQVMEKLIRSYTTVRQTIDNTFKKDDITVLNEFSKRQFEAQQIISQNSQTSQQSRIKNTKIIDYKLFEDETSQLSGILQSMKLTLVSAKTQY